MSEVREFVAEPTLLWIMQCICMVRRIITDDGSMRLASLKSDICLIPRMLEKWYLQPTVIHDDIV